LHSITAILSRLSLPLGPGADGGANALARSAGEVRLQARPARFNAVSGPAGRRGAGIGHPVKRPFTYDFYVCTKAPKLAGWGSKPKHAEFLEALKINMLCVNAAGTQIF
jgi:hypothetical protein